MRDFWRDGVPALTVEQRHLEVFTSAVTEGGQNQHSLCNTNLRPYHTSTHIKRLNPLLHMQRQTNKHVPEQTHKINFGCVEKKKRFTREDKINCTSTPEDLWTSVYTHAHLYTQSPPSPSASVTQYDFLQIPKSDPGWNISARLPRQFAYTILPLWFFVFSQ